MLTTNSQLAERERGCVFAEKFENAASVIANGGTITGTPVIDNGAILDGTGDKIVYNISANLLKSGTISWVFRFTPDFNYDEAVDRYFFTTTTSNRIAIRKSDVGKLEFVVGESDTIIIESETYGSYWKQGEENILVFSGTTGDNNLWLNGNQILTDDTTAWTEKESTEIRVGGAITDAQWFDGKIHELKFFTIQLTDQEALDYSNGGGFWNYMNETKACWCMRLKDHDPTNSKTIDGVNGYDLTYTDATKNTTIPGYTFNGSSAFMAGGDNLDTYIAGADKKFSVGMLFKLDPGAGLGTLFSKYSDSSCSENGRQFLIRASGTGDTSRILVNLQYTLAAGGDARTIDTDDNVLDENVWLSLVTAHDGSLDTNDGLDRIKFYLGTQDLNTNMAATVGSLGAMQNTPAQIGVGNYAKSDGTACGTAWFDGVIAGIWFWDQKLTHLQAIDHNLRQLRKINDL